jgi:hypothetical protein
VVGAARAVVKGGGYEGPCFVDEGPGCECSACVRADNLLALAAALAELDKETT